MPQERDNNKACKNLTKMGSSGAEVFVGEKSNPEKKKKVAPSLLDVEFLLKESFRFSVT